MGNIEVILEYETKEDWINVLHLSQDDAEQHISDQLSNMGLPQNYFELSDDKRLEAIIATMQKDITLAADEFRKAGNSTDIEDFKRKLQQDANNYSQAVTFTPTKWDHFTAACNDFLKKLKRLVSSKAPQLISSRQTMLPMHTYATSKNTSPTPKDIGNVSTKKLPSEDTKPLGGPGSVPPTFR